jgi:hypothetical protein
MKGTPFYTGEWTEREGNVEDRVALWPFVYYRNPALSVLWPIFEKSPDHIAIRPIYTVKGLEGAHRTHHIIWPLGKLDFDRDEYRFFPVFLGDDYFVVFPLYWHFDDPFLGKDGSNALFPFWIYDRSAMGEDRTRHILHVAWPFARFEFGWNNTTARIFPLFGAHKHLAEWQYVVSIPFGWIRGDNEGDSAGWCLPFYAYRKEGEDSFLLTPVYQRGHASDNDKDWHMVAPLYYRAVSASGAGFYSLIGGWSRQDDGSSLLYSPLYVRRANAQDYRFDLIPPLLSWRTKQSDQTNWHVVGPLSRLSFGEKKQSSYIFPVAYKNPRTGTFLTPVFQKGGGPNSHTQWHSVVPFYLRRKSPDVSAWITPLGAMTRNTDGGYRTITPLYVHLNESDETSFLAIPPLLSWRLQDQAVRDYWLALGLARFGSGAAALPSHLIPLYYRNPQKGTTVTPLWASWTEGPEKWTAVPPLLSWQYEDAASNRTTRVAAGLYGQKREKDGSLRNSHLIPIYLYERNQYFFTPLVGRDALENGTFRYWFTPLIGTYRNKMSGSWAWPLYRYRRNTKTEHTRANFLLWGYHEAGKKYSRSGYFPFFSRYQHTREPLEPVAEEAEQTQQYGHRRIYQNSLSLLLLYRHYEEVAQYGPANGPVIEGERYLQRAEYRNRFFPMWSYQQQRYGKARGPVQTEGSVLWKLYDFQREQGTEDQPHEYVRHRILWRVWHYEKLNGQVSVDSIPFITYDSKPDGFRKISFLWRAFRYENDPDEGRKLDLLFVPLLR